MHALAHQRSPPAVLHVDLDATALRFDSLARTCLSRQIIGSFRMLDDPSTAPQACGALCAVNHACTAFSVRMRQGGSCYLLYNCTGTLGVCDPSSTGAELSCTYTLTDRKLLRQRSKYGKMLMDREAASHREFVKQFALTRGLSNMPTGSKEKHNGHHNRSMPEQSPLERMGARAYLQAHWNPGTSSSLDCSHVVRVGAAGDGGKLVCEDALPKPHEPCYVLSIGHGGDWSFEQSMHELRPNCTIEVFDGTNYGKSPPKHIPGFVNFFPRNFDRRQAEWHREHHGNTPISVFKIDCEGCEYKEVLPFLEQVCVEQMQIEIHSNPPRLVEDTHRLLTTINLTLGVFYKEPNIQFSTGTCVEFAFRRRETAPPCRAIHTR